MPNASSAFGGLVEQPPSLTKRARENPKQRSVIPCGSTLLRSSFGLVRFSNSRLYTNTGSPKTAIGSADWSRAAPPAPVHVSGSSAAARHVPTAPRSNRSAARARQPATCATNRVN
eukprot:1177685-Prorocentrum_minimum.AAC.1